MNGMAIGRLFWKEYRAQRAFLVAMLALAAGAQCVVYLYATFRMLPLPVEAIFGVSCAAVMLYALGCHATLFATEHEAGTFGFQQSLPVLGRQLFWGKFGFAWSSTLLVAVLLVLTGLLLAGGSWPAERTAVRMVAATGMTALEMAAWGAFFSLTLVQPLRAALLAIAAQSLIVHALIPILVSVPYSELGLFHYAFGLNIRSVMVLILLTVDIGLCLGWLRPRDRSWWSDGFLARPRRSRPPLQRGQALASLLWQQYRQTRGLMLVLFGLVLVHSLSWLWLSGRPWVNELDPISLFGSLIAFAPLFGAAVFVMDHQQHGYRFLVERGISPTKIWLSRQLPWLAGLSVLVIVAGIAAVAFDDRQRPPSLYLGMIGLALVAYSVGQFCSLLIRSGILATTISAAMAFSALAWCFFTFWLGVPVLLAAVPVPVILLAASWYRTRDWLLERETTSARLRLAATVLLPMAFVLSSVAVYRWQEIPVVVPAGDLQRFTASPTPEAVAATATYREIGPRIGALTLDPEVFAVDWSVPGSAVAYVGVQPQTFEWARIADWLDVHRPLVEPLADATRASEMAWPPAQAGAEMRQAADLGRAGMLLFWSGVELEMQSRPRAAWQRYSAVLRLVHQLRARGDAVRLRLADELQRVVYRRLPYWAASPGQGVAQIQELMDDLDRIEKAMPSRSDRIKAGYLRDLRILSSPPDWEEALHAVSATDSQNRMMLMLAGAMPWEVARTRRYLAHQTWQDLQVWETFREKLERNEETLSMLGNRELGETARTTPLAHIFYARLVWSVWNDMQAALDEKLLLRSTRLALAMEAWRWQHGQLPTEDEWDRARAGFLDEPPLDPYTAAPLAYVPGGPDETIATFTYGWVIPQAILRAGQPYLSTPAQWSWAVAPHTVWVEGKPREVEVRSITAFPMPYDE